MALKEWALNQTSTAKGRNSCYVYFQECEIVAFRKPGTGVVRNFLTV